MPGPRDLRSVLGHLKKAPQLKGRVIKWENGIQSIETDSRGENRIKHMMGITAIRCPHCKTKPGPAGMSYNKPCMHLRVGSYVTLTYQLTANGGAWFGRLS